MSTSGQVSPLTRFYLAGAASRPSMRGPWDGGVAGTGNVLGLGGITCVVSAMLPALPLLCLHTRTCNGYGIVVTPWVAPA